MSQWSAWQRATPYIALHSSITDYSVPISRRLGVSLCSQSRTFIQDPYFLGLLPRTRP